MKSILTSADPSGWYLFVCNSLGTQVAYWDGQYLRGGGYTFYQPNCRNFRRLYYESDVAALNEELRTLREELSRLKSQPYEMRRADKPDCVGLWRNSVGQIVKVETEADILGYGNCAPYHYLGPIPVIVEQQPPRVVKVRCKKTGEVCRAIPSPCGSSLAVINDDGSFRSNEMAIDWEEVQS